MMLGQGQAALAPAPVRGGGRVCATPRAGAARGKAAAFFGGCALFAGGVALADGYLPERRWGLLAAAGYPLAAALTLARDRTARWPALLVSFGGAVAAPLGWLAAAGRGMPEVSVIVRSAGLLLRHGSPYLSRAAPAGHRFLPPADGTGLDSGGWDATAQRHARLLVTAVAEVLGPGAFGAFVPGGFRPCSCGRRDRLGRPGAPGFGGDRPGAVSLARWPPGFGSRTAWCSRP